MMKSEFESLAGRNVTDEQYKAIETLYMSSNLEKAEFVKSIRTMLKSIPQPEKKKDIKRMVVRDRSGYRKTREEYDRLTLMQEVVASNTTGIVESVTQFQKDAVIDEYTQQLIEEGLI